MVQRLWRDFPLLIGVVYAVGIAHAEEANLVPPRRDLVPTALFPLALAIALYALRWRTADRADRRLGVAVVAIAVALIGASVLWAPRAPIPAETLRRIYEVSAIAGTVFALLHAFTVDRARLAWLLGPTALYGVLLENGGILLGYFDELHYALYLGPLPAPVATMAGWMLVFYQVTWTAWEVRARVPAVRRSVLASALVATAAGLLLDLQLDPLATAVGFWRWNVLLPGALFGVPMVNFVAWGCAIFPFAYLMFWRQTVSDLAPEDLVRPPHRRWLLWRVPVVLGAAAGLFLLVSAVTEAGFGGPTFTVLGMGLEQLGVDVLRLALGWR